MQKMIFIKRLFYIYMIYWISFDKSSLSAFALLLNVLLLNCDFDELLNAAEIREGQSLKMKSPINRKLPDNETVFNLFAPLKQ